MRSSIKHAMKRGENVETIKKKYFGKIENSTDHKKLIKL